MISLHVVLAVLALVSFLLAGLGASFAGRINWTALGFFFAFAWVVVR